jgi:hypothetical protein
MARTWGFAAVPAAGLLELGAHAVQTSSIVPERDWRAAREYVVAQAKPEDLVLFSPRWADPIGRETFGPDVANLEREARPDDTRFPRAFEVSIRGAHASELEGWRKSGQQRFGGVTVTAWENPAPAHVIEDLVSLVSPQRMRVTRGDYECPWARAGVQSGGLGFGPAVPAERFACVGGGFAGMSVVADLDYVPHRCIFAPPSGSAPLRLHFRDVHFGHLLHGHHALYVEAERNRTGAPVTISFRVGDASLGSFVHRDGDGWKPFEVDTSDLAGKAAELVAEISSPGGDRRLYCFEADTR